MRFELNVDNDVWAGLLVISSIIEHDENSDRFNDLLVSDEDKRKYIYEVNICSDNLSVIIDEFSMQYKLTVNGFCTFYDINFEEEDYLFGDEDLSQYETLYERFCELINSKSYRIITNLSLLE